MRKRISQTYRIICSIQIFKAAVRKNVITSQLFTDDNSKSEITPRNKEIIENIVKRMDTMLKSPESILITQYDEITKENDEIYMIAKGKCRVEVTDKFVERSERFYARTLDKGDHFGEIAMVYHPCRRSATVSVEKAYYLTCAKINKANYNELL
jgi:CRP-like cAMP-binding protein